MPVTVQRQGKRKTLDVTIAKLTGDGEQLADANLAPGQQDAILNIKVDDLTREQREELEVGDRGVLVLDVESGPAADAGIAPDDVILELNHKDVANTKQLIELAKDLPKDKAVPVLIQRNGSPIFLALKIPNGS